MRRCKSKRVYAGQVVIYAVCQTGCVSAYYVCRRTKSCAPILTTVSRVVVVVDVKPHIVRIRTDVTKPYGVAVLSGHA